MELIGILCSELFSQYNAKIKKNIAETGLSLNQAKVLLLAGILKNYVMTQKDLAKICNTDTPSMSRTIDKLEKSGYIIKSRRNEDYRCVNVSLSESGIEKSKQIHDKFDSVYTNMLSVLSDDEKNQLKKILKKIEGENEVLKKISSNLSAEA